VLNTNTEKKILKFFRVSNNFNQLICRHQYGRHMGDRTVCPMQIAITRALWANGNYQAKRECQNPAEQVNLITFPL